MPFFLLIALLLQEQLLLTNQCPQTIEEVTRIGGQAEYWHIVHEERNERNQLLGISFLYQGSLATFSPETGGTLYGYLDGIADSPQMVMRSQIPTITAEMASYRCSNILSVMDSIPDEDIRELPPGDIAYGCRDPARCQIGITMFQGENQQIVLYAGDPVDIVVPDGISFSVMEGGTRRRHIGVGPMMVRQIVSGTFTLLPQRE